MNRAYSTLEIKSVTNNSGRRLFTGIASTPSTDRAGDIVEPKGAEFKLPIPLLWQHESGDPIGWITSARVTEKGISVDGEVADVAEPGALKDRLTMAWQMIVSKLVRGLSIGFNPKEFEPIDGKRPWGPQRFLAWEWLELSAVTIPANQDASIQSIKSIDARLLAASGRKAIVSVTLPGASGKATEPKPAQSTNRSSKGSEMKTMHEMLSEMRDARTTKNARMNELMQAADAEKRRLSEDEASEFETLKDEVGQLDDDVRRKELDILNSSKAKPVTSQESARRSSSAGYVFAKGADKEESFKGQNYVRMIKARAMARFDDSYRSPATIAESLWGKTNPTLVAIMKANEVPGGGSESGEWGAELVQADTRYTGDFIEYLYGATVFDRLPLRAVPANVVIKGQDGASTGYWIGQSKAIKATTGDFSTVSLAPLKVAALCVLSNELIRDSTPAADALMRDSLVEASAQRVDTTFLSATAASSGVSPAGILNGLTSTPPGGASGADAISLRSDIKAMYAPFLTAKNATGLYLVMQPGLAKSIGMMITALGTPEFTGLNAGGGNLLGDPVVTGDNVPSGYMILLKPSDIYKIGDSGVQISISRDATIEQSTAPTGATDTPVAMSQAMTSMFQEESTAIKVVRSINFAKRRASAVSFVSGADYGDENS